MSEQLNALRQAADEALAKYNTAVTEAETAAKKAEAEAKQAEQQLASEAEQPKTATEYVPCPTCGHPVAVQKQVCPKHDQIFTGEVCPHCAEEKARPVER
jgi:DNA repair exonuclease SbcCD ATPase subunit